MPPHDQGLFAIARGLCTEAEGDVQTIKSSLLARGYSPRTVKRVMHQMRMEGHVVRAAAEFLTGNQRFLRDARANVLHLVDLKRAGHRSRDTELSIPNDGHAVSVNLRTRRLRVDHSAYGSPAAMCAEFAE